LSGGAQEPIHAEKKHIGFPPLSLGQENRNEPEESTGETNKGFRFGKWASICGGGVGKFDFIANHREKKRNREKNYFVIK